MNDILNCFVLELSNAYVKLRELGKGAHIGEISIVTEFESDYYCLLNQLRNMCSDCKEIIQ